MKRMLASGAIVLSMAGISAAQEAAKSGGAKAAGGAAQAVMELENKWAKAAKASDGDTIATLLAGDFVAVDADGSMHGKAEVVARTKKSKWETNAIADVKVMVHGDAAVATGTWVGKGTDDMGKPVNARERWTDTWVKMPSGSWQCVASASTAMK